MKNASEYVECNVDYLKQIIRKTGMKQKEFSIFIGQSESFAANTLYRKSIKRSTADLICRITSSDINKLLVCEPKPLMADDKSMNALVNSIIRMEEKIDRIIEVLL